MRVWVTALLVSLALAGCAEEQPEESTDAAETSFEELGGQATATTGLIRGVVLDPAIVPVASATVRLSPGEIETITNEDGAFLFSDLEPGTYFLEVSKIGFTTSQTSSEVVAGDDKPPIVKVQIVPDPGSLPVIEPFQFNGHIMCSAVTPAVRVAICSVPGLAGIDTGDDFITYLPISTVPDFAQAELIWKSTQPLGEELALQNFGGSRSSSGPSPQMINGAVDYWAENTVGDNGEELSFRVFAGGLEATQAGGTWGFGITLDQSFEMFIHVFYNMTPPEGWWFINDGTPDTGA